MIFFKLILLSFFTMVHAQDKILFLDLNNSKTEVAAAQRVAKIKGKELIVYPKTDTQFNFEELKKIIRETSFSSLCLSGHNGGDSYSGKTASVNVHELMSAITNSPSHQSIEGLYLLGCNGANKTKIFFWKEALPNLKFIAGYDGSAPLNSNENGVKYFEDALGKQSQISSAKNAQSLKQLMTTLNSVNNFESSVYANCGPLKKEYLFLPRRPGSERFGELSTLECATKINEFKTKYLESIKKYLSGEIEPTLQNPSSGFLKDAYVFMRQNEHCLDDEDLLGFNGDQLLFLRFNKAFNENYFDYYKEQLQAYLDELNEFTDNTEAFLNKIKDQEKIVLEKLLDIQANPQRYQPVIEAQKKKIQQQKKAFLDGDPAFARCLNSSDARCARFEAKFLQYNEFENRLGALDSYQEIIKRTIEDIKAKNDSYLRYFSTTQETLKLKSLIQKGISQPSKITRKEIMDMSHLQRSLPNFSKVVGVSYRTRFDNLEEMSSYRFPFSWHERIAGKVVEPPLDPSAQTPRYFEQSLLPELGALAKVLDNSL
jgi:hypothetical protein